MIIGPLLAPRLVRRFGARNALLGCFGLDIGLFLAMKVFDTITAWFLLRAVLGLVGSAIFTTGEAWINQLAGDRRNLLGVRPRTPSYPASPTPPTRRRSRPPPAAANAAERPADSSRADDRTDRRSRDARRARRAPTGPGTGTLRGSSRPPHRGEREGMEAIGVLSNPPDRLLDLLG